MKSRIRKWRMSDQGRLYANLSKLLADLEPHEGDFLCMRVRACKH